MPAVKRQIHLEPRDFAVLSVAQCRVTGLQVQQHRSSLEVTGERAMKVKP